MTAQEIETVLNTLKVDSIGRIIGKSKAINKIQSLHLKKLDSDLTDIRIFVGSLSTGYSTAEALKMIDEFIYKKSIQ